MGQSARNRQRPCIPFVGLWRDLASYLYTGLDESEILDQIAADCDIYSLTDYFDEYVGD